MSAETTRHVVLLRHAKAERTDGDDHERPLAARGREDAPAAGRWLAGSGVLPDLALCSTAARCRETWRLALSELPEQPRTVYEERVYRASPGELIALLNEVGDEVRSLVVIGHNPGIHELADALTGEADGDPLARMHRSGLPTSAIAVLAFTGSWRDIEPGAGRLTAFWAPHA
ncbi:SixA phosphatase family protein [Streptomyces benahoarensis]|uniref:Histidine phosphatase family protein n=1 Tax=Streptomyces benahoarensis TaxID=2595054 RepID=A0A553YQ16_9ACTN|nr:histidine phosphatase family protein [Streptomyces benahoarensis]TSB18394.1 histidine phosphatase family protein [Streptomyces benahoarensis]TSB31300.1 histidine phosphatase family protein [Streptomyces benahoarensis]